MGFGSGRLENQKGLRLRKIGKLERASAQEDWKTGRGFGSGRSKGWKKLRRLTAGGPEGASWKDRSGGKGASPGNRR